MWINKPALLEEIGTIFNTPVTNATNKLVQEKGNDFVKIDIVFHKLYLEIYNLKDFQKTHYISVASMIFLQTQLLKHNVLQDAIRHILEG